LVLSKKGEFKMAGFDYKDLMVSFTPIRCICMGYSWQVTRPKLVAAEALDYINVGGGITPAPHCLYRTEIFLTCAARSLACPGLTNFTVAGPVGYPGPGPEDLAAVKEQLREAVAEIERQERAVAERSQPNTEAEVESLQAKLHEAISELEKRKQALRREPHS
jgi:hypothetical protein